MERIEGEKFINTPFLILIGDLDDATLAKDCVDHQAWTNANGGNLKTELVPGAYHDFDAPHALQYRQGQNISKCTYVVSGDKITIVGVQLNSWTGLCCKSQAFSVLDGTE
jgi:dienelactone hydrolase